MDTTISVAQGMGKSEAVAHAAEDQAARLAGVRRNLILLREAREAAGLSQRYVADLCAVSVSAVSRWESGDRCPSGMTALALAQVLTDLGVNIYAP